MTKKYLLSSMVSVLVITIGVSLAFFSTRIKGEGNPNYPFEVSLT